MVSINKELFELRFLRTLEKECPNTRSITSESWILPIFHPHFCLFNLYGAFMILPHEVTIKMFPIVSSDIANLLMFFHCREKI